MNRKFIFGILIATFGLFLYSGCQKKSESNQGKLETQKGLVECMDEYHRVLRPLMHQALPDKDVQTFKENAKELLSCAERMGKAEIPEKLEGQKSDVESLVNGILTKTKGFYEATQAGSDEEIFETFMAAHDDYEALADIVYKL